MDANLAKWRNWLSAPPVTARSAIRHFQDLTRRLVQTGQLQPGERIPANGALAALAGVHGCTMHRALSPLVKEGLLVCAPRRGTFVREPPAFTAEIGVYFDARSFLTDGSDFNRALYARIATLLQARRIRVSLWLDERTGEARRNRWNDLWRAAEERRIQGLIASAMPLKHSLWLRKLPVPVVHLSTGDFANKVNLDFNQFWRSIFETLQKEACRTFGAIGLRGNPRPVRPAGEPLASDWYGTLCVWSRRYGFRLEPRFVFHGPANLSPRLHADFGYTALMRLWRQRSHPEGLVIYPDSVAPGVIAGLLQEQVRIPGELKVVCHRNQETPLLCPMPIMVAQTSIRAIAEAAIRQIEKQLRGMPCTPIWIPFQMVRHTPRMLKIGART